MELKEAMVMVVDDEAVLLDIFSEWLQEENCRVLTAGDGTAALQILRNHHARHSAGTQVPFVRSSFCSSV